MHEIRDIGGYGSRPERQQTGTTLMVMVQVEDRMAAAAVEAGKIAAVQMEARAVKMKARTMVAP